jgi:hypothetical protein
MARRKPEVDELLLNIRLIERLMKRNRKIGIFGLPGEGKSYLIRKLAEKYRETEWHFYDLMNTKVEEPFVWAFINENIINHPEFDVIYCLQYSTDYKESITGISFPDWKPMTEYQKMAEYRRMGKIDIKGKFVKNLKQLKNLLNEE